MNEHDEIETMLARLEAVEPPPDFVAAVMARVRQGEVARWPRWQRVLFGCVYVAALCLLAVLAFLTGMAMEHSGLRELLTLAAHDLSAVRSSPGPYLTALREAIPWPHIAALLADVVLVAIATRLLLRVAGPRASGSVAGLA